MIFGKKRSMSARDDRLWTQVRIAACLLSSAFAAGSSGAAFAQDAGARAPAEAFAAEYFAPFNPVSAEDMVRRIPGFTLNNGEDRRGLAGAAGNVLINGERPSSKTPISEQLARLSARDVLRIDLYAGGSDGGEIRGQEGLYVDVRMRPRDAKATNTFVAQFSELDPGATINSLIIATSAFKLADASVNVALQAQPSRRGRIEYDKELRSSSGALLEQGDEFLQGDYWEYKLSARANWKPTAADAFSLNAQVTPSREGRHTYSETFDGLGAPLRTEDSKVTGDNAWAAELGGDWERKLSDKLSFKLIGLASGKHTGSNERYTTRPVTGVRRDTLIERGADSGEYVGRGVLNWRPLAAHSVSFGAEGAFNYLDSALDIRVQTPLGSINATPPVANTRVEEMRGEAYVSDFWQVARGLKMEVGLAVETSRISQSGDAEQKRDFTYLKPRLNLTWSAGPKDQIRFLLNRDVAQLDFTEFASAVSLFDGTQNIGNPNLEPERTWRAQVDWERRFGAKGVLTLSAFHDDVEAVQDQIPIAGFDGPGNLGKGSRDGVKLDAMAPLDWIGLAGGEARIKGMIQKTRVNDPLTGLSRSFSDEPDWNYSIDVRQPLPGLKLLWGLLYERADDVKLFRLHELRTTGLGEANLDLYVETTAIKGLVVRFTMQDVLLPVETRERAFFTPDRSSPANLSSVETRHATGGYSTRSYGVRVSGRF
jgi:outer membrane receptor protein involved in Fe transport